MLRCASTTHNGFPAVTFTGRNICQWREASNYCELASPTHMLMRTHCNYMHVIQQDNGWTLLLPLSHLVFAIFLLWIFFLSRVATWPGRNSKSCCWGGLCVPGELVSDGAPKCRGLARPSRQLRLPPSRRKNGRYQRRTWRIMSSWAWELTTYLSFFGSAWNPCLRIPCQIIQYLVTVTYRSMTSVIEAMCEI